ncbi:hypothetical protein [Mycolicibacterium duvalii]|uniref:hypothetical protein n=1 Tax=Mycolicibacterium duvalii TaxID=39688 RepID=UPI001FD352AA|nr:hypothetical protein [Mycolicibacterium duvalii]
MGGQVDDIDGAADGAVGGEHEYRVAAIGDVPDRRADRDHPAHPRCLGVDDHQLATLLIGDGDVDLLGARVDADGVDVGRRARADVDGSDAFRGGVDDRQFDPLPSGAAGVHPLAVRTDRERGDPGGQWIGRDHGPALHIDHRDGVMALRRDADVDALVGCDDRYRLAVDGDGCGRREGGRVEERHRVVGEVRHHHRAA